MIQLQSAPESRLSNQIPNPNAPLDHPARSGRAAAIVRPRRRCHRRHQEGRGRTADTPRDRDSAPRQTGEVLARLHKIKPGDKPLVLVTHQVMVTALSGIYPQSGEVVVVAPTREGGKSGLKVLGSIKPEAAK